MLHAFENSFDSHLRFGFRDACPIDDFIDDVEFDQCLPPKEKDRPSGRIWGTNNKLMIGLALDDCQGAWCRLLLCGSLA